MNDLAFEWSLNKHDRTFVSASTYWLTRVAYHVAPDRVSKLMREKGFSVKPFHLTEGQRELLQRAHSFHLEYNQNKIRVFEWGTGPVILLVHGWAGRALQLDALISALLNKGYKVVAFDQKGHGESSTRFSSYPEIVRGTDLVSDYYGKALYGVVAHSIGSNAMFKVSETFARKLKIAAVSPTGDILNVLDDIRVRMGIDKKLLAHVVRLIEADSGLQLSKLNKLDYSKIARHDVLLVHDKFDKINKVDASHAIHSNLPGANLMLTEMLGHSRILGNQAVVDRIVAHFETAQR